MPASNHSHPKHRSSSASKAILVAVQLPESSALEAERSLRELEYLVLGLGIPTVAKVVQKRSACSGPTYLGEGKLRELAALTGGAGEVARVAEPRRPDRRRSGDELIVVVDDELSPAQLRNLETALDAEVLDRTAVILRVFESRARTREAMLEVELARLEYELPRIRDDRSLGDREGGGGRAGRGHTNVELAKQRARERIAAVRRELAQLEAGADRLRGGRAETFRVALVGYTNAGKSSVMRQLTGSDVYVEDKLFATLGTTVRQLSPAATPPVVVADTVGFIHRLPHQLVASFRSTFAEASGAWLLLHVVDASDAAFRAQLGVTERVLAEIGAGAAPTWVILNKVDRLQRAEREALASEFPDAIQMSALETTDCAALRERIVAFFGRHLQEERLSIPYSRHRVLAEMRDRIQVVEEEYGDMISVTVRGPPEVLGRLRKLVTER